MTITNHVRKIQNLADHLIIHVDVREYKMAHFTLDEIEISVKAARDHIDNLQQKADCAARPPGGG